MKTKTITLKNDIHGTECRVRVSADAFGSGTVSLSAGQTRRVHDRLCGAAGCACGTLHGRQDDVANWVFGLYGPGTLELYIR